MQAENNVPGIVREDNLTLNFEIKKEGTTGEWEAVNLTGMDNKIWLSIRREIEDDELLLDRQLTITDAAAGLCKIDLTRIDTKMLWYKSRYQKEVGGNGVVCEVVYRNADNETTYGQFWLRIFPDLRRA